MTPSLCDLWYTYTIYGFVLRASKFELVSKDVITLANPDMVSSVVCKGISPWEVDDVLYIFFGEMPDAIYNTEVYFQNVYEDKWITDEFAREVIHKVDKSEVLDSQAIKSPVLGIISPERLSGGTKTLLLIKNMPDQVFNASTCGDNCARYILKLAKDRDVTINLRHLMNFGKRSFQAMVLNDHTMIHNMEELLFEADKYV